jgi:hypothetical protein
MSRKKKKDPESVLQSAKLPSPGPRPDRLPIEKLQPPDKRTSPIITVPLALVGIAVVIFTLVRLIRWAWFF